MWKMSQAKINEDTLNMVRSVANISTLAHLLFNTLSSSFVANESIKSE